jgi:cell division protease FtsH
LQQPTDQTAWTKLCSGQTRIEKHLLVPAPNESARKQILDICLRGVNSKDLSVDDLVKMTDGYSGAEINELVNSAKKVLIAESVGGSTRDWLTMDDFKTAIDKKEKETLPTNGSSPRGF